MMAIAPVIVMGAGGHAGVVIDALALQSVSIIGITDPDASKHHQTILGIPVIGTDDVILGYAPDSIKLVNGLGSLSRENARTRLFTTYKERGYAFSQVVHPSSVLPSAVVLSEGVQIMAGAVIQTGTCIGANTIINTRASVDHDCHIGSNVHVAPGVTLSGGVSVGDGAHIGVGATVLQGVHIGADSMVGAAALVLKDVPDGETVIGVPARVVEL